ncbi:MAG: hypothetical protein PVI59_13550 [Anaerolineae bacterium]|jgi:uncharacterized repeat protein (TIGR01451 family)
MKLDSSQPVLRTLLIGVLLLSIAPLGSGAAEAAPAIGLVEAGIQAAPATSGTRSYTFTPTCPPEDVDAEVLDATFTVAPGDFPAGWLVDEVTVDIDFAKSSVEECGWLGEAYDYAFELAFRLLAPDGTRVPLVNGDYEPSSPPVGRVAVTFDDAASTTVEGLPIQAGTFLPSGGAMADFRGIDPATDDGVWTLEVVDRLGFDYTCFYSATLSIATLPIDLSVAKTGDPNPVYAGQEVLYQLTAHNGGQMLAEGVMLTDTLPSELTYVTHTDGCTFSPGTGPGGEDQLLCGLGSLAPDSARSVQVLMRVPPDAVAAESDGMRVVTNQATVGGVPETYPENDTTTYGTVVRDLADLRVTKLSLPDTAVRAGEAFTYTLVVDNLGPSYARNVTLRDDILAADGFTLLGVVDDPDRCDACGVTGGTLVECTLDAPLEPQGSGVGDGRWTVEIEVQADEAQTVSNLALVHSADPDGPTGPATATQDPDTANNEDDGFVSVTAAADLELTKAAVGQVQVDGQPGGTFVLQPDAVTAGGRLTYTLAVTNHGPSTAENVAVEDRLPSWLVAVSADPSQGLCNTGIPGDPLSPLVCNLGTLAAGEQAVIAVAAQAAPDVANGMLLTNEAWVSSATFDPDNTDDFDVHETFVDTWADLAVEKEGPGESVLPGVGVTYVITASNLGPSDAPVARISDLLPFQLTGVTWDCAVSGGASCAAAGSGDLDEVVAIPAGGAVVCSLQGTLAVGGDVVNTAVVTTEAGLTDPFSDNNSATVTNGMEQVYLPLVFGGPVQEAPDLVVTEIVATSYGMWVTVQNQGDAPVVDGFWVDAYVDPDYAPRAVNQVWTDLGDQGIIWGVGSWALPLDPEESLVLRVGDRYYWPDLSDVSWPLPAGTPVYVQVDSYSPGTTYGLVLEDHEILGGSYNNVAGPVFSTASSLVPGWSAPVEHSQTLSGDAHELPPRER